MQVAFTIASIFAGESLIILSEVRAARIFETDANAGYGNLALPIFIAFIGALFLIGSYVAGIRIFKDIWTVTALSVSAIIIFEPIINYAIFRELPGRGAAIGLAFGFSGLIISLWK